MQVALFILLVVLLLNTYCVYLWYRNDQVYKVGVYFTYKHYELYGKLPSYEEMLYHPKHYLKWSAEDWLKYIEQLDKGE